MTRCAALLAVGLLASTPSNADEFCDVFLRVVNDAGSGFAHIRGEGDDPGWSRYDNVLNLPGALVEQVVVNGAVKSKTFCSVYPNPDDAKHWRYECAFPDPQWHKDAQDIEAIGAHLDACLLHKREIPPVIFVGGRNYTTAHSKIELDQGYATDGGEPNYFLSIDQKAH